jgi:hypothetical protein
VSENDYQLLGKSLDFLYPRRSAGIDSITIENIQMLLGVHSGVSKAITSFDSIFTNALVSSLAPDEMVQVVWHVRRNDGFLAHAFLLGRLRSGRWFVYDQGPGIAFEADSLVELDHAVRDAAAKSEYWIYVGNKQDLVLEWREIVPSWTGVKKLNLTRLQ